MSRTHFEQAVITAIGYLRSFLNVMIKGPKVLNSVKGYDSILLVLPGLALVCLEEPKGP